MDRLTTWLRDNTRWLRAQLRRRGCTHEDAEDLIQQAYLRVFEYCRRGEVREPEKVLVRTVSNLSLNARRDQGRRPMVEGPLEEMLLVDAAPLPDEALAAQERLRQVVSKLESVDPRSREAFLLHRVDGLSYQQIARQMGVSVSTVEKRIARAMAALLTLPPETHCRGLVHTSAVSKPLPRAGAGCAP